MAVDDTISPSDSAGDDSSVEGRDGHASELHLSLSIEGLITSANEPQEACPKIMIVGDSMTHGQEGDWTWRYRIWEWFRDNQVAVDFVGPYIGTLPPAAAAPPALPKLWGASDDPPEGPRTGGGYAKGVAPDFDSRHFAVWGRSVAQDKELIRDMVSQYQPDYLLVMLGFNDMGWFVSDAKGTLESMQTFVEQARLAKKDIRFALADVPQRSFLDGREDLPLNTDRYNEMLKDAIPTWTTQESPIELVQLRENYACDPTGCPAGYDGLHPNALGEYQIASAFSKTLYNKFHMGNHVLEVPADIPERPTPIPSNVEAVTSPSGITVTWGAVYGAFGYDVRWRISGREKWQVSRTDANRYDSTHTTDGDEYEYQVRTNNGDTLRSDWSATVSAISHPQTIPPPENITAHPTPTGVSVSWTPSTHPDAEPVAVYHVVFFDQDAPPGSFPGGGGFLSPPAHISDLIPGHHYAIAVESWTSAAGSSPLGFTRNVTVGTDTPPIPSNLKVTTASSSPDNDTTTLELSWDGSPAAAGYTIWSRRIDDEDGPFTVEKDRVSETKASVPPGHEYCVRAFNGDLESERSGVVILAPVPQTDTEGSESERSDVRVAEIEAEEEEEEEEDAE